MSTYNSHDAAIAKAAIPTIPGGAEQNAIRNYIAWLEAERESIQPFRPLSGVMQQKYRPHPDVAPQPHPVWMAYIERLESGTEHAYADGRIDGWNAHCEGVNDDEL